MKQAFLFVLLLLLFATAAAVGAQDEPVCSAVPETVIDAVTEVCGELAVGQVCYGSGTVEADFGPDAEAVFTAPGDTADAAAFSRFRLSPTGEDSEAPAVILLALPNEAEFPTVTARLVIFGDVELTRAEATSQTYTFTSGLPSETCPDTLSSGILAHAVEPASITLNEVQVEWTGTMFLEASTETGLSISVLDGSATVTSDTTETSVAAGERVAIALDDDGNAGGPAETAEPYDETRLDSLPLMLLSRGGTAVCSVTAGSTVNRRSGPGTGYAVVAPFDGGTTASVVGQAVGSDRLVWWKLEDESWVRSDVVDSPEACAAAPTVEAPPPPDTSQVISNVYYMNECTLAQGTLQAGSPIQFFIGAGGWRTSGEARQALPTLSGAMSVDSVPLNPFFTVIQWGPGNYGISIRANWTPTPGTHTVQGSLSQFSISKTCPLTVE